MRFVKQMEAANSADIGVGGLDLMTAFRHRAGSICPILQSEMFTSQYSNVLPDRTTCD